jgi:hypothetical protein
MKSEPPSKAQLRKASGNLSYRSQQLAEVVSLMVTGFPALFEDDIRIVITNAFVEAALVNSRALAYFLTPSPRQRDVHFSHFAPDWKNDVCAVAGRIVGVVSEYLAHASLGDRLDQSHPGAWPLPELALVLVGGCSDFVLSLDASCDDYEVTWFTPSPANTYRRLLDNEAVKRQTPRSDNPKVAELTTVLQQHLRASAG